MVARIIMLLIGLLTISFAERTPSQEDTPIRDKEISVVRFEEMKYPPLALQTRVEGIVVVRVRLDSDGKVVDASAISGSEFLTPDSVTNAKKWRFQPNPHGAAVIVYNFRLQNVKKCKPTTPSSFALKAPNLANITACPTTVQP